MDGELVLADGAQCRDAVHDGGAVQRVRAREDAIDGDDDRLRGRLAERLLQRVVSTRVERDARRVLHV